MPGDRRRPSLRRGQGRRDPRRGSPATRGAPAYLRFDNGPEFIARAVADWCRFNGVDTVFIDPGSPWQNAWIESFNGRLRDELLNGWHFDNLLEAQVLIEDWRIDYNTHRPHSAHGDLTPNRVRPRMDHPKPTSTRITAGPLNGDPSPPHVLCRVGRWPVVDEATCHVVRESDRDEGQ